MSQEIRLEVIDGAAAVAIPKRNVLRLIWAAMRPHQWVKNLFIFAPLLFGRKLTDPMAVSNAFLAFAAFCLVSSGLYIFNDWVDSAEDRAHPEKRLRPIASGELSAFAALTAFAILSLAAIAIAFFVGKALLFIVGVYFVLILAYCLVFKRLLVLDCITIAAGFVLRVVGGAVAVAVAPSHWLIACAFLLALLLAFTKRRQEILVLSDNATSHRSILGEYSVAYLDQINNILIGTVIVCYALYTVAPETIARFGTDALIYGTVFVIYGMFRYLALIKDPANGGNPSKMLITDTPLMLTVAGWAAYNAFILYLIPIRNAFGL